MITGQVNVQHEAIIRLRVRGPAGVEHEVEAVVDTGFTSSLTLPAWLVAGLGLPFLQRGRALLADGSETIYDIYEAIILWDGQWRQTTVDVADVDPLIGMRLLRGYQVTIEVVPRGRVEIRALTP